jgi:quercetin dioxygenase-like cupin family protein
MKIHDLPFGTVDWNEVEATTHAGTRGEARWRTREFGDVRVRMLDYSAGYEADHWCSKGHFLLCLEGELETELADGRRITLRPGTSYHVADGAEPHRSRSRSGVRLFVVD